MKAKKLFLALPAMAVIVGGLSISPTTTSASEHDVQVSYDNSDIVDDPDNPGNATWGVSIPTRVVFTDTSRTVGVDVKLVNIPAGGTDGTDTVTTSNPVKVEVKSTNEYKLKFGAEELPYTLTYGTLTASGAIYQEVAQLHKDNLVETGSAVFTGNPVNTGLFTDTLTYQISRANP